MADSITQPPYPTVKPIAERQGVALAIANHTRAVLAALFAIIAANDTQSPA